VADDMAPVGHPIWPVWPDRAPCLAPVWLLIIAKTIAKLGKIVAKLGEGPNGGAQRGQTRNQMGASKGPDGPDGGPDEGR
jgi:hypothetical protein